MAIDLDYFLKQMQGQAGTSDPRSLTGIMSRGDNVYSAGVPSAPGAGAPTQANSSSTTPYQLPFDPDISAGIRDIQSTQARSLSDLDTQQQRVGQDYQTKMQSAQLQQQADLEGLANKFASQGITHSGINIGAQGDLGRGYQQLFSGMATDTTRGLEDIIRQRTDVQSTAQESINRLMEELARRSVSTELQRAMQQAQLQANQGYLSQLQG